VNELQELESILDELLAGIGAVLESGEVLSIDFQTAIAQELSFLTDRIDTLKQQAANQGVPPLDPSYPSSVINAFKYDPKNQKLFVQFKGKWPNEEGNIYSYDGVPPQIANIFSSGAVPAKTQGKNAWGEWYIGKNPSMGASMNVLLKEAGFPYKKLS